MRKSVSAFAAILAMACGLARGQSFNGPQVSGTCGSATNPCYMSFYDISVSSLAIYSGPANSSNLISYPTNALNFDSGVFGVSLQGATSDFITINYIPGSIVNFSTITTALTSNATAISTTGASVNNLYTVKGSTGSCGSQYVNGINTGGLTCGTPTGGSGGSSSLAVFNGTVQVSSPTGVINFNTPEFLVSAVNTSSAVIALNSSSVTLQGNTFNGDNELVLLTSGGLLPVLNGSNLTNLTGANVTGNISGQSGSVSDGGVDFSTITVILTSYQNTFNQVAASTNATQITFNQLATSTANIVASTISLQNQLYTVALDTSVLGSTGTCSTSEFMTGLTNNSIQCATPAGGNSSTDLYLATQTVTTSYVVPSTAALFGVNCATGYGQGCTVTLPLASAAFNATTEVGQVVTITKVDASSNPVTVVASGGALIEGTTGQFILNAQGQGGQIYSDGSNWWPTGMGIQQTPAWVGNDGGDMVSALAIQAASDTVICPFTIPVPVVVIGFTDYPVSSSLGLINFGIYNSNNQFLVGRSSVVVAASGGNYGNTMFSSMTITNLPAGNYFWEWQQNVKKTSWEGIGSGGSSGSFICGAATAASFTLPSNPQTAATGGTQFIPAISINVAGGLIPNL